MGLTMFDCSKLLFVLCALSLLPIVSTQSVEAFTPPGKNIALSRPCTFEPQPSYDRCTDAGDVDQLTDGKAVTGGDSFWTGVGCVGWDRTGLVTITLDLGQREPIGGLSFRTATDGRGIRWPTAILILVSDDGEEFRYAGDLRKLSARFGKPAHGGVRTHTFRTDALNTRGRYVRFGIVPLESRSFCDELEIYRGSDELLEAAADGPVIPDLEEFAAARRAALALGTWIASDIHDVRKMVAAGTKDAEARRELIEEIDAVEDANATLLDEPPADYRAIYPLSENHGRLGRVLARMRQGMGYAPLFTWHRDRWKITGPWDAPPAPPQDTPSLAIRLVNNERQAETLNIANYTGDTLTAKVWFSGLPGGKAPAYADVRRVEYVAMLQSGSWDADALPKARRGDDGWRVTLHPGVSRQVWLGFHPRDNLEPGRYQGEKRLSVWKIVNF
jgi:hypothetical protein